MLRICADRGGAGGQRHHLGLDRVVAQSGRRSQRLMQLSGDDATALATRSSRGPASPAGRDDHASILPIINFARFWPARRGPLNMAIETDRLILRDWREADIDALRPAHQHAGGDALAGRRADARASWQRSAARPADALAGGARLHLLGRSSARRTARCSAFAGSRSPTPRAAPVEGDARGRLAAARGCLGAGLCEGGGDRLARFRLRAARRAARGRAHLSSRTSRAGG